MPLSSDDQMAKLLNAVRIIALVGASAKPDRPSNRVMAVLLRHGYRVIPVNPGLEGQMIHGQPVVASLAGIDESVDMVDIFRDPARAGETVDEAIEAGAGAVWMQMGVVNEDAARRAEEAGLTVVMDRCPAIEISRLGLAPVA